MERVLETLPSPRRNIPTPTAQALRSRAPRPSTGTTSPLPGFSSLHNLYLVVTPGRQEAVEGAAEARVPAVRQTRLSTFGFPG